MKERKMLSGQGDGDYVPFRFSETARAELPTLLSRLPQGKDLSLDSARSAALYLLRRF